MGFKYSARHWDRQPEYLSLVDFTHPLSWGFDHPRACFYVFSPGFSSIPYDTAGALIGGSVFDATGKNNTLINTSASGYVVMSSSVYHTGDFAINITPYGSAPGLNLDTGVLIDDTVTKGTVYWGQVPGRAYNIGKILGMWGENLGGGGTPSFDAQSYSDGNLYIGWYNGSEMRNIVANTAAWWTPGQLNNWAFTWVNGQKSLLYNNGVLINTASNVCSTYNFTSNTMHVGTQNIGLGNNGFGGHILYFGITSQPHSPDLIEMMASNAYQMLLRPRRVWKQATTVSAHTWATTMGLTVANTATVDELAKANIATNLGLTP